MTTPTQRDFFRESPEHEIGSLQCALISQVEFLETHVKVGTKQTIKEGFKEALRLLNQASQLTWEAMEKDGNFIPNNPGINVVFEDASRRLRAMPELPKTMEELA